MCCVRCAFMFVPGLCRFLSVPGLHCVALASVLMIQVCIFGRLHVLCVSVCSICFAFRGLRCFCISRWFRVPVISRFALFVGMRGAARTGQGRGRGRRGGRSLSAFSQGNLHGDCCIRRLLCMFFSCCLPLATHIHANAKGRNNINALDAKSTTSSTCRKGKPAYLDPVLERQAGRPDVANILTSCYQLIQCTVSVHLVNSTPAAVSIMTGLGNGRDGTETPGPPGIHMEL